MIKNYHGCNPNNPHAYFEGWRILIQNNAFTYKCDNTIKTYLKKKTTKHNYALQTGQFKGLRGCRRKCGAFGFLPIYNIFIMNLFHH